MSPILIIAALIIVFLLFVATRPPEFRVSRTALINASPATIFAQVDDLRKWDAWSPWAKLDPNAQNNFEGATSGKGASMSWSGNKKVGRGSMTITESRPNEAITITLAFLKPMKATNTVEFAFVPEGGQTSVTWSMSGKNNYMGKLMGLIFNCEKMVGGMYEKGLANLKTVVEKA